jgi:hypothetical protein
MRIGSFEGPTGPYGAAVNVVHPVDNDITPSVAAAEADAAKALADELYEELQNTLRDPNAPKTTSTALREQYSAALAKYKAGDGPNPGSFTTWYANTYK